MNENMVEYLNTQGITMSAESAKLLNSFPRKAETDFGLRFRMEGKSETVRYFPNEQGREMFCQRLKQGSRCEYFEYMEDYLAGKIAE